MGARRGRGCALQLFSAAQLHALRTRDIATAAGAAAGLRRARLLRHLPVAALGLLLQAGLLLVLQAIGALTPNHWCGHRLAVGALRRRSWRRHAWRGRRERRRRRRDQDGAFGSLRGGKRRR